MKYNYAELVGLGWVYLIEYTINRFKNLGKHR